MRAFSNFSNTITHVEIKQEPATGKTTIRAVAPDGYIINAEGPSIALAQAALKERASTHGYEVA